MKNYILILLLLAAALWACIKEDDEGGFPQTEKPNLTLNANDIVLTEGNVDTTFTFKVQVEGLNLTNVIVTVATVNGSAVAGNDFVLIDNQKLLFGPSVKEKEITLTIRGDLVKEEDESFELRLFDVANANLLKDHITITILNDDINPADFINIPETGYTTPESYDGYNLVWQDDFSGDELNSANWTHELGDGCPGNCGWGNNELEYYRPENTLLTRGYLVIEAKQENFGGKNYTSSRMITKDKKAFKFGRVDIRAVLPEGKGLWPALWALGANISSVGWPACGEIDIMELTGERPNRVIGTAHFGANLSQHQFRTAAKFLPSGQKFSQEFHVFSIIWKEDIIQWYMDDQLFHTITPANLNGQPYPFNEPFFFVFNVAVGGNLPGSPDATTVFPQRMIVDYIRVFQEG